MKKLFFVLTTLLFISCSSDDDSLENENGFLTVYEDVVFLQETTEEGFTYSFWLIFSPEGVIEGSSEDNFYCDSDFFPWNVEVDGETYEVIKNSSNTLKVRYTYVDTEYPEDNEENEVTISVSDNVLTITFDDGETSALYKAPFAPC